MTLEIMKIERDLKEVEFPSYMLEKGYKCKKLYAKNHKSAIRILNRQFHYGPGVPDFLVYNDAESFLCEFKSLKDSIRLSQVEWAASHMEIKVVWAFVSVKSSVYKERETNPFLSQKVNLLDLQNLSPGEYIEEHEVKIINLSHRLKDYYMEEYIKKHPRILNSQNFRMDYDIRAYLGEIPNEVAEKCDVFDEKFFKDKHLQEELMRIYEETPDKIGKVLSLLGER